MMETSSEGISQTPFRPVPPCGHVAMWPGGPVSEETGNLRSEELS